MVFLMGLSVRSSFPNCTDAHNTAVRLCYEIQRSNQRGRKKKKNQAFMIPSFRSKVPMENLEGLINSSSFAVQESSPMNSTSFFQKSFYS